MGRAPRCFFALSFAIILDISGEIDSFKPFSEALSISSSSIFFAILHRSFSSSSRNIIISSILLISSGLKKLLSSSRACGSSDSLSPKLNIFREREDRLPRFDVMIIIVFLKLTRLPDESVRVPSSNICKRIFRTSGCAFSISSRSRSE